MGIFGPVRINQPIEIEIQLHSGPIRYKSRVEGILDTNLIVGAPIVRGEIIPIKAGKDVTISYLDNIALYTFDTKVLAVNLKPIPTITLDKPRNVRRVQRRNFVRIDSKIPITYRKLQEDLKKAPEVYEGTTIDISGGGIMFSTTIKPNLNDLLEINLELPDQIKIIAVGKVVRVFDKRIDKKTIYSVGVEFTIIEEADRDKIIRYIFNQQRELRRKGLL